MMLQGAPRHPNGHIWCTDDKPCSETPQLPFLTTRWCSRGVRRRAEQYVQADGHARDFQATKEAQSCLEALIVTDDAASTQNNEDSAPVIVNRWVHFCGADWTPKARDRVLTICKRHAVHRGNSFCLQCDRVASDTHLRRSKRR